jgi:hypothetical protein
MADKLQLGALEVSSNEYTTPTNATKDKQYKCVDCNNKVILRKGTIRKAHFAHHSQTNTCSYYDHPNESQIHKDAKLLMAKMLTEKKLLQFCWDCLNCGSQAYAFEDTSSIHYKEEDQAVLEYRDPNNKWVADVALVNNGEVRYIFEIKNTHATISTVRPEPWFEVDAKNFIEKINDYYSNTDPEFIEMINQPDFIYIVDCTRQNIKRYCYGSFCYKEKWVRCIPGYDKKQKDNYCLICKKIEYEPITDGCTSKFQNGEIRVCFDCIEKDTYEKKIRKMFANDLTTTRTISGENIYTDEDKELLKKIPSLFRKAGMEDQWKQVLCCVGCSRNSYSPVYENKKYYSVCKICFDNNESKNNIKSKLDNPVCLIIDD